MAIKLRIIIFVFFAVCLIPLIAMFISSPTDIGANETAVKAPDFLTAEGKININYLGEFSEFFDDRFGLRENLISLQHKLVATIFGESEEKKVIMGKDGWLFYSETLSDYEGTDVMSEREVYSTVKTLSLMSEYCRENGMDFIFTIAPNKNSLYSHKMPSGYPKSKSDTNAELIGNALLSSDVSYVNLFDAFKAEASPLYRKTDSHWINEGAGLAADKILAALGKSFIPYYGSETKTVIAKKGDLYNMLYPAYDDYDEEKTYVRDFSFEYARPIRSLEDNMIYTTSNGKEDFLFMFRDSFGNTLHPFLANEFEKSTFSRLIPYNLTLAKNENADVVVVEIVERNLRWLISKGAIFPSPSRDVDISKCASIKKYATIEMSEDDNLFGYTKIKGNIQTGILGNRDNIGILLGDKMFEAVPCENDGFIAYVSNDAIKDEFDILIYNN